MIRPMTTADLPRVLAIEEDSFAFPWTKEMFESGMALPFFIGFVEERVGEIVGFFCGISLFETAEVHDVATSPSHRQQGVAEGLMRAFEEEAKKRGGRESLLEVRVSNLPAQTLYQKLGYETIATRKKYYENGEDAFVMRKVL